MRKSKKVQGPHFEVSPELGVRWDRMMRRLGRGACTRLMTTMMEEVLKQLEKPKDVILPAGSSEPPIKELFPNLEMIPFGEVQGDKGKVGVDQEGGGKADVDSSGEGYVQPGGDEDDGQQAPISRLGTDG